MNFRFKKIYDYDTQLIKQIEKVSESLIMFNIALESDSVQFDSRPLHKRYKFGDFPPLDISFDSETGMLREFTIFIKKENIVNCQSSKVIDLRNSVGYPCFEFINLEKHEYYYDEECQVDISICDANLYIRLLDEDVAKMVRVSDSVIVMLNDKDEFAGFTYDKLSENDLNMLCN